MSQQASDPSAPLLNLQIANLHFPQDRINVVLLQPVIPFKTFGIQHISRFSFPYFTDTEFGATGVGDLVALDLLTFEASWGRYGFGPVASLPTAVDETLGTNLFSIGPAALAILNVTDKLQVGILNQNLFSVAGPRNVTTVGVTGDLLPPFFIPLSGVTRRPEVALSIIQPFFSFNLGNGFNIGSSEIALTYDWKGKRWSSLPLGLRLSKAVKSKATPIVLSFFSDYNFAERATKWQFRAQVAFLFP